VAGGARGVGEGFEFAFALLFGLFVLFEFVVFGDGEGDEARFAKDQDFGEASLDSFLEVGDLFQLGLGLEL
jgi:hypothetical protein